MSGDVTSNNNLNVALADLTLWLQREQIPFAVIGGVAVGVRGEPRFTADVDVVIGLDLDDAMLLIHRLHGSRFEPLFADVAEVVQTSFILPLRHVETGIKVDAAIGLSGFEQQLLARATEVELAGVVAPVATVEDLILMKLFAGRPRDSEDCEKLAQKHGVRLDWEYLSKTARQLEEALAMDLSVPLHKLRERHASDSLNQ